MTMLAWSLRLLGRFDEAIACCVASLSVTVADRFRRSAHTLVYAEALADAGRIDEARAALKRCIEELEMVAGTIGDPLDRASFRERSPDNARALALAAQWRI
jgi:hypothetical protein